MSAHYDVIIIGGRCAGASLAIRLARQHLKVLVVDRAEFPSLPAIPSSPIIHAGTMRLMDELGLPEAAYTFPDGKIEHYSIVIPGLVTSMMHTAQMEIDRNYMYGVDRNHFDDALWSALSHYPTVTVRECFSVTSILKDDHEKTVGIIGRAHGTGEEQFTADLIVGADGRFSFAAREFGAKTLEEHNDYPTASYHAEWENVEGQEHTLTVYNGMKGLISLFIPINTRKYIVATYMRFDQAQFGGQKLETGYLEALQTLAPAWKRLEKAQKVTQVVGVRKIQNGYREAFGNGWALVGDALHYKDPLDGQGIYDALVESKLLAEAIHDWKKQGLSWWQAGEQYQSRVMEETHAMMIDTVSRVKQQMYSPPPTTMKERLLTRWMLTDPVFQRQFLRYLNRALTPDDRGLSNKRVLLRGLMREVIGQSILI